MSRIIIIIIRKILCLKIKYGMWKNYAEESTTKKNSDDNLEIKE